MTENIYRNFTLDNSLAAISAVPLENQTLATDGNNCVIHQIDTNGNRLGCQTTLKPLRRLRNYDFNCTFTALGCCNERNLYFLDSNLNETGLVRLEIADLQNALCARGVGRYNNVCGCNNGCNNGCGNSCNNGCNNGCGNSCNSGCGCGCNSGCSNGCNSNCSFPCTWDCGLAVEPFSELTDASLTQIGNETFIVGVFPKGAYLFDLNGKPIEQLCKTDRNEVLTDFIHLPNGIFAMSTLCGNLRTITICDNRNTQSGILDKNLTLRMLIALNGEIYGLFGQNYIYNRIIKIYSGGLNLPKP